MEKLFQGASALALDGKGRINVPARHRDVLAALAQDPSTQGELTITKHPDRCLLILPRKAWVGFREQLIALPWSAEPWRRIFLGNAMDVDIDATGRLLVPPELRGYAGFVKDVTKEVLMMGMGRRLELWNAERYAAKEEATLASAMPESIQNFVF